MYIILHVLSVPVVAQCVLNEHKLLSARVAIRQVFPGHVRDFSGQLCVREKC